MHKKNLTNKNFKLNIGGTDERDFEQAIQDSLNEMKEKGINSGTLCVGCSWTWRLSQESCGHCIVYLSCSCWQARRWI